MKLGKGAVLSVLKLVNTGLGFLLGLAVAWVLRTGAPTDALFAAWFIPVILARELPRVVGMVLVPFLVESQLAERKRVPDLFMTWWIVFLGVATVAIVLASRWIIRITVPGLPADTAAEAVRLLQILAPSFFLLGLFGGAQNLFYARRVFYEPELAATAWRVVAMVALFVAGGLFGVRGYAVGLVAAAAVQLSILAAAGRRHGIPVAPITDPFRDLDLLRPLLGGAATVGTFLILDQANPFVDRFITSFLPEGSISILSYGDRLAKALPVLMATSFISVFIPELSTARAKHGDMRRVGGSMAIFLMSVGLPLAVLVVWSADDLVHLVLHHGNFTAAQAPIAAATVVAYALGIPASLTGMGIKGLYFVERNTREVARFGILALLINTLADLALFPIGVEGIALSSSLTVWIVTVYLWKRANLGWPDPRATGRILAGAVVMCGLLFALPWPHWLTQPVLRLAVGVATAGLAYVIVVYPYWKRFDVGGESGSAGGDAAAAPVVEPRET